MARMAAEPSDYDDELFDQFLSDRGHDTTPVRWDRSYNKLQCPDCGAPIAFIEGCERCSAGCGFSLC